MGPGPITRLLPRPRPVTLGGRVWPVWEARLSDLADLQAWVDARRPDPLEGLAEAADAAPDGRSRDRLLLEAYEALEGAQGASYDDDGSPLFSTLEGLAVFTRTALARGTPGVSAEDVAEIVVGSAATKPAEFAALRRAFYGSDPLRTVECLLGVPRDAPGGEPLSWGEAVDALARSHNWTYEYIYSLTLTEFLNARRLGKPKPTGFRVPAGEFDAWQRRVCLARHGVEPDAYFGAGPEPSPEPEPEWVQPSEG